MYKSSWCLRQSQMVLDAFPNRFVHSCQCRKIQVFFSILFSQLKVFGVTENYVYFNGAWILFLSQLTVDSLSSLFLKFTTVWDFSSVELNDMWVLCEQPAERTRFKAFWSCFSCSWRGFTLLAVSLARSNLHKLECHYHCGPHYKSGWLCLVYWRLVIKLSYLKQHGTVGVIMLWVMQTKCIVAILILNIYQWRGDYRVKY